MQDVEVRAVWQNRTVPSATPIVFVRFSIQNRVAPTVVNRQRIVREVFDAFDDKHIIRSIAVRRKSIVHFQFVANHEDINRRFGAACDVAHFVTELVGF